MKPAQQFNHSQLAATIDQTKLLKKLGLPAPSPKPAQFADTYHLPELLLLTLERLPPTVRLCYTPAPAPGQPCAFDLTGVPPQPAPQPSHYRHLSPAVAVASLLIDLLKQLK